METASDSAQRSEVGSNTYIDRYMVSQRYEHLIGRTYEEPCHWYYLVFKPFNDSYDAGRYKNCLSILNDLLKSKCTLTIATRELLSAKAHVNALVVSPMDLTEMHEKTVSKRGLRYRVYAEQVYTTEHRFNVFKYMFKENETRPFDLYKDHIYYDNLDVHKWPHIQPHWTTSMKGGDEQRSCRDSPVGTHTSGLSDDPDSFICPPKSLFKRI